MKDNRIEKQNFEKRLKILCVKWEAIRRHPEYHDDYIQSLKVHTGWLREQMVLMKKKDVTTAMITKSLQNHGEKAHFLLNKWEMVGEMVDPRYSFLAKLFPRNVFTYKKKVIEQLTSLFPSASVLCREEMRDIGYASGVNLCELFGIDKKRLSSRKDFSKRKFVTFFVDITRSRAEIMRRMEEVVVLYKHRRIEEGLEKPLKKKPRRRREVDSEIFKTYDFVASYCPKDGKFSWARIARELKPNDKGLIYNCATIIKAQCEQANHLIYGGFRDLD